MTATIPTADVRAAASADRTPTSAPRRRRRGAGIGDRPGFLTYGLLLAFFLASAYPLWWSFIAGSSDSTVLTLDYPPLLPGGQFWVNAAEVLDTIDFWKALANSLIVSSVITLSVMFFSTLAGYAFAKLTFRGSNGLMVFVILTLAVPTQLGMIPLFILMKDWGWTGTLGAIIVPTLVTAFGVFFMRQYLVDVIPFELIEAARVDGASMIRTFWHVGLPAARPAMAILGLFTFMTAWTDYMWPLIVAGSNPTLQVALSQLQSAKYVNYPVVLAGAVMATIPLLILFVVAGRQLVSGIMAGAVKG